jgi:hypothetical protein
VEGRWKEGPCEAPLAWWDHYYLPLRARVEERRRAWADDEAGSGVIALFDTEIDMYERWGHTYGCEFFVGRSRPA